MRLNIERPERALDILTHLSNSLLRAKAVPHNRLLRLEARGAGYTVETYVPLIPPANKRTSINRTVRFWPTSQKDNIIVQYGNSHVFLASDTPNEVVFGGNYEASNKDAAKFMTTFLATGKVLLP